MKKLAFAIVSSGWLVAAAASENTCLPDGSGLLTARLRGDVEAEIDWREPTLACTGMRRPDGLGLRLHFSATLADGSPLALVFAAPLLAEGEDARAVPVNVTVLRGADGRIYGTRGEHRCLLDEVTQRRLPDEDPAVRRWAVQARGFCTEPARALDDSGSVLLTRFDFQGLVTARGTPEAASKADPAP
jgi:hypothetical protein